MKKYRHIIKAYKSTKSVTKMTGGTTCDTHHTQELPCRRWMWHYTHNNNLPCRRCMYNGSFLSTSYMHVWHRRTVTAGPLVHRAAEKLAWAMITLTAWRWLCYVLTCDELSVRWDTCEGLNMWRVDRVTRWPCDELTGDELTAASIFLTELLTNGISWISRQLVFQHQGI